MKDLLKKIGELSKEKQKEFVLKFNDLKELKGVIELFGKFGINVTSDEARNFFEMSKKKLTPDLLKNVSGGNIGRVLSESCETPILKFFDKCEEPVPIPDGPPAPSCHMTVHKVIDRNC